MPDVIKFKADDTAKGNVVEVLEEYLEKARAGEIADIAVIAATRDEDGPAFQFSYYGEEAYATLIAGVSALEFDLHYRRYVDEH